jgi:hypothetical protein
MGLCIGMAITLVISDAREMDIWTPPKSAIARYVSFAAGATLGNRCGGARQGN